MTPEEIALWSGIALAIIGVIGTWVKSFIDKKAVSPGDKTAAESAANDLIIKLLDRAESTITRNDRIIEELTEEAASNKNLRAIVGELEAEKERAIQESVRLRKAINHLRERASRGETLTHDDIVIWANNALDFEVELDEPIPMPALPPELEDTGAPATRIARRR